MEQVAEASYRDGIAEADRDIAANRLKLRFGARGTWGEDLSQTLKARFGVELIVLSCFATAESSSADAGYNDAVEAHIDTIHGVGSVKAVWDEVQQRRKVAYDEWAAEQKPAEPVAAADGEVIT